MYNTSSVFRKVLHYAVAIRHKIEGRARENKKGAQNACHISNEVLSAERFLARKSSSFHAASVLDVGSTA